MPHRDTYVPKHRAPQDGRTTGRAAKARPALRTAPSTLLRTTALLAGIAVTATGVTVVGGVLADPDAPSAAGDLSAVTLAGSANGVDSAESETPPREPAVSRSDSRDQADPAKAAALSTRQGLAVTRSAERTPSDPRDIARALLPEYGFPASEFGCLDALYVSESDWDMHADNPTSSAYGIPQALTESHDMPAGYFDSAEVQIRWGLDYIRGSYGTPCAAWEFKQANQWY